MTCFRSHNPIVINGTVATAKDAAIESTQEVVEVVAAHF